jgi:hypothetical protein
VVASRTAVERTDSELLRPLRTALTQLVLSGLPQGKILDIVGQELRTVTKGNK